MKPKKKNNEQTFQNVINFLASRGYLYVENSIRVKSINLSDALSVGTEESRVFSVLPAALLRSKKGINIDISMPEDLKIVLESLKKDLESGPDFRGVTYKELRRWANLKVKDSRSKPQRDKKITKSFRFDLGTIKLLKEQSEKFGLTETKIIEDLIKKAPKTN